MGLLGMYERVGMVDGQLRIESAPGRGTSIEIRLPLTLPAARSPSSEKSV
jgi:signal transduction histidine kinase